MDNFPLLHQTVGHFIRELRIQKGVTGMDLAHTAGISQSKLSKIETDSIRRPLSEDINKLLAALAATEHQRQRARWLMGQPRANYVEPKPVSHNFEEDHAAEMRATELKMFTLIVPVLLQTAAYQSHVLNRMTLTPILRVKAQRLLQERQDRLWDPKRRYSLVMYESALYSVAAGYEEQIVQIDRIERLLGIPTLSCGIIPFTAGLVCNDPCSFVIYDDASGYYEYMGKDVEFHDATDVQFALSRYEALANTADFGSDILPYLDRAKQYFSKQLSLQADGVTS